MFLLHVNLLQARELILDHRSVAEFYAALYVEPSGSNKPTRPISNNNSIKSKSYTRVIKTDINKGQQQPTSSNCKKRFYLPLHWNESFCIPVSHPLNKQVVFVEQLTPRNGVREVERENDNSDISVVLKLEICHAKSGDVVGAAEVDLFLFHRVNGDACVDFSCDLFPSHIYTGGVLGHVDLQLQIINIADDKESATQRDRYGFLIEPGITHDPVSIEEKQMDVQKTLDFCSELEKAYLSTTKSKQPTLSSKLKRYVRDGFPLSKRAETWQVLSGSKFQKMQNQGVYQQLVEESARCNHADFKCIELDLRRTFPTHPFFNTTTGEASLRRILRAYVLYNKNVGYRSSMNFITGFLLLVMDEESAFWTLGCIIEKYLPLYFGKNMIGAQSDEFAFSQITGKLMPQVAEHLERMEFQLSFVCYRWFLCLYIDTFPTETTMRVWDLLFSEGRNLFIAVAVAVLRINQGDILNCKDMNNLYPLMMHMAKEVQPSSLLKALNDINVDGKAIKDFHAKFIKDYSLKNKNNQLSALAHQTRFSLNELESLYTRFQKYLNNKNSKDSHNGMVLDELDFQTFQDLFCDVWKKYSPRARTPLLLQQIFKTFDRNQNNLVDFHELILGLAVLSKGSSDEKLQLCFNTFDLDHNGSIDRKELYTLFEIQYQMLSRERDISEPVIKSLVELTLSDLGIQGDRDRLDFEQFKQFVSKQPLFREFFNLDVNSTSSSSQ